MYQKGVYYWLQIVIIFLIFAFCHNLHARIKSGNNYYNHSNRTINQTEHRWPDENKNIFYEEKIQDYEERNIANESYEDYIPERSLRHKNRHGKYKSRSTVYYKRRKNIRQKNKTNSNRHVKKKIKSNSKKAPGIIYYKIKNGDTLIGISKKFRIPVSSICSINSIKNRNKIRKGMILKLAVKGKSKKSANKNRNSQISKKFRNTKKTPPGEKPKFRWPLKNIIDYKKDGKNGVKSIGIIISGRLGSSVLSSASGVVKKIGQMRGFGKYIVIKHKGRFVTVYANLSRISVTEGERITSGNVIGKINKQNKKLHFQIAYAGRPENPLKYLPKKS